MKKFIPLSMLFCLAALPVFAQVNKSIPPSNLPPGQAINLNIRPWMKPKQPAVENPFGVSTQDFAALSIICGVKVVVGEEGLPISFEGTSPAAPQQPVNERNAGEGALAYLKSLQPAGIQDPTAEFVVSKVEADNRKSGVFHVHLQQQYRGVPVYGAELIAHTKDGIFISAAGRYIATPSLESVEASISAATAIQKTIDYIGADKIKRDWSADQLELIGGQQFRSSLVIYRMNDQNKTPRLAWNIEAHPNMKSRLIVFADAQTGAVLHSFDYTCTFSNHSACASHSAESLPESQVTAAVKWDEAPPPVTGTGVDLEGITRSFGAWQHTDGKHYLVDITKPMFNGNTAVVPNGAMQGVIVTRDQKNIKDGSVFHITSTTNTFNNPNAVSAHYNAGLCYDYYQNTFGRNSIDGNGGAINVVVNVVDEYGDPMDNAYWNGNAMYWGNGNTFFTPLAKSLDITGHEMTHGVVQETAGLIYENESGALNESFADIFGVMIDRDDWGIAEGVVQPGQTPTGMDRDLSNPHNGAQTGESGWQPSHYSEKVLGSDDNGGVHANSGITNYAYYLFATHPAVGKETAEQVYYYVLRDRLTASSKFVDLRLAVIAEATQYYSTEVVDAAIAAFNAVGITTGTPTAKAPALAPGQGSDYILSVTTDGQNLDLSSSTGVLIETMYEEGVLDKPSVTDNGEQVVFVNAAHQIAGIEIAYNSNDEIQYNVGIVSEDTIWRNAAISKDGRFLAGLTTLNDNKIIIFDLADPLGPTPREYFLVNPTFTQATPWIDNVDYADVLEFDYSGTRIMYDAYSFIENAEGEDVSHWDIGLLKFWENGQFTSVDTPNIRKLITGLPEQVGVADPAFAKNDPELISFDYYIDLPNGGTQYLTYVANIETGNNGPVVSNGLELGYPCFTTHDDKILFQDQSLFGGTNLRLQKLAPNGITPQGNPGNVVLAHKWGTWLNNGTRVLTVGTQEGTQKGLAFSVSPNPTGAISHLNLSLVHAGNLQWNVTNLFGQTLLQRSLNLPAGDNQFDVDLQSLPPGSYFLHVLAGEKQGAMKIIKQ